MAVDNTAKQIAFITAVRANAAALKAVRDQATQLRELRASDAALNNVALVDATANVFTGDGAYMNATIIDNYLAGVTLDVEKCLTNQTVATSNRLPNFLAAVRGS